MTGMRLKELESKRMDMSHTTLRLKTMATESKQHALELWMKRVEDLTKENELLKRGLKRTEDLTKQNERLKRDVERREVKGKPRRKKEKEMEEKEIEKSDTSIVGDANPVNTTEREPEIEEELLKEQEEIRRSQTP